MKEKYTFKLGHNNTGDHRKYYEYLTTCHAFKQALRQNTGLRRVYLHFRQTHAALPKSYGAIRENTCTRIKNWLSYRIPFFTMHANTSS
jgi:hypothetical protein